MPALLLADKASLEFETSENIPDRGHGDVWNLCHRKERLWSRSHLMCSKEQVSGGCCGLNAGSESPKTSCNVPEKTHGSCVQEFFSPSFLPQKDWSILERLPSKHLLLQFLSHVPELDAPLETLKRHTDWKYVIFWGRLPSSPSFVVKKMPGLSYSNNIIYFNSKIRKKNQVLYIIAMLHQKKVHFILIAVQCVNIYI